MIVSFKHKGLKRFFETGDVSKIQPKHEKKLRFILALLNAAKEVKDVGFPGSGLHPLKGNRREYWALTVTVTVNGNWRITFKFESGDAHVLDYIDYH